MLKTSLDYNTLTEYFRSGCKQPSALQIGVEWEKIGIDRETGNAIPYSGARGVRTIFEALQKKYGWQPTLSQSGDPIALKKGPTLIALEPGGQIELSGQQAPHIFDNGAELRLHLVELREVSKPLGIVWLGIGAQPFSRHEEIEWVPKDRYDIMRDRLKGHGDLTFAMMKETASVQVSLDYTSEADAVEKLRLAMALAPVFTAMFANSPFESGNRSAYLSRRTHIWHETDPDRTGILWDIFQKPSYSFADYMRYALAVPILFIHRDNRWISLPPMTFEVFMKSGWSGFEATLQDWELHLTTIFLETRLKKYLEIRTIDCQNIPMGLAAVAFVKGLFYSADARRGAWNLLKDMTRAERQEMRENGPKIALKTPFKGRTLLYAAEALAELAQSGLAGEERGFLEPLKDLLRSQRCPAEKLLECGCDSSDRRSKIDRLIECAAI